MDNEKISNKKYERKENSTQNSTDFTNILYIRSRSKGSKIILIKSFSKYKTNVTNYKPSNDTPY